MSDEDKNRLRNNIHLAEQLGATIETTYGDDVALQIAEFAGCPGYPKSSSAVTTPKNASFSASPP